MADIVNLRRARKAKARRTAETTADANRLKFGQTKAEKAVRRAETRRAVNILDRHRLDAEDKNQ